MTCAISGPNVQCVKRDREKRNIKIEKEEPNNCNIVPFVYLCPSFLYAAELKMRARKNDNC